MPDQLSGRIETFSLADLLQWLEINGRSGRLTLQRGDDRRTIDWIGGTIVYVSGSRPPDRLGVHLAGSGALPAARIYELLARNFTSRKNLTQLILDGGHLSFDELARLVEQLSRRLLMDVFRWSTGRFEFNPHHYVEDILKIHLRLKGQVVAFQAAHAHDDSMRQPGRETAVSEVEGWERYFHAEEVDDAFWRAVTASGETQSEAMRWKDRFYLFRLFAKSVHLKLAEPPKMAPIYEDTARITRDLLLKKPFAVDPLLSLAALDPFLTLDLFLLANSLSIERRSAVTKAPAALDRIGVDAFVTLIECLSSPHVPTWPVHDRALSALRRASVAAAVAAGKLAEAYGVEAEEAYALGLLHALGYADIFDVIRGVTFEAGPFRRAAIESFRPIVGRTRADAWGLSPDFERVLGDEGGDDVPVSVQLVRAARRALPSCTIGVVPEGREPEKTKKLPSARSIRADVEKLFEFLGLGKV